MKNMFNINDVVETFQDSINEDIIEDELMNQFEYENINGYSKRLGRYTIYYWRLTIYRTHIFNESFGHD